MKQECKKNSSCKFENGKCAQQLKEAAALSAEAAGKADAAHGDVKKKKAAGKQGFLN